MNRVLTLVLSIAVVSALIFSNTIAYVNATIAAGSATSTNTKTPIKYIVVLATGAITHNIPFIECMNGMVLQMVGLAIITVRMPKFSIVPSVTPNFI